jgi:hypothetical protein
VAHLLWLASFPKSGNTWLRAFLANYLADAAEPVAIDRLPGFAFGDMRAEPYLKLAARREPSLSWAELNRLRPQVHRAIAASGPGIVFVKTHSALTVLDGVPTITPDVTFGAIHVVRNPLDVAVSFAEHYGLTLDQGVAALGFARLEIDPKPGHVRQFLSDWSSHARGWLQAPGLYRLTLRYEDLLADASAGFRRVLDFLKVKDADDARLQRAIRHSSFAELARQEAQGGFVERSKNAARFFHRGRAGGWREILSPAQVEGVVSRHRAMMAELGYLDEAGRPR